MWTAVGLKTLTCGACLPTRESWGYGHKRGSRAHAGMAMVVVEVRGWWKFPRWKAFLPSCPATSLCARATRVLGLRRPRITFTDGEVRVRGQRPCRRHAVVHSHAARSAAPPCCAFTCGAGILGLRRAGVATRGCLDCHASVRMTRCVNLSRAGCQSCARWRLRPCDMDGRRSCQP